MLAITDLRTINGLTWEIVVYFLRNHGWAHLPFDTECFFFQACNFDKDCFIMPYNSKMLEHFRSLQRINLLRPRDEIEEK